MITLIISLLTAYGMYIIIRSVGNHIYLTIKTAMDIRYAKKLKKDLAEMINLTVEHSRKI